MESRASHTRVFLPCHCLQQSHGVLIGSKQTSDSLTTYMVINILSDINDLELLSSKLRSLSDTGNSFKILGFFQSQKDKEMREMEELNHDILETNCDNWIMMEKIEKDLPLCAERGSSVNCSEELLVILYDCSELMSSVFFTGQTKMDTKKINADMSTLEMLVCNIEHFEESVTRIDDFSLSCFNKGESGFQRRRSSLEKFLITMFEITRAPFTICERIAKLAARLKLWKIIPATTQHMGARGNKIKDALEVNSSISGTSLRKQRSRDHISIHALDVLFGLFLMTWLLRNGRPEILANLVLSWAEHVVTHLRYLLQWMNGAPAGLKLNRQLNELLGKFFMYHIYLWTGYLGIIQPLLVTLVHVVAMTGILGISTQLAVTHDLITMLTLHIYCFYIYAAKLYSLQIYTLTSLWRLFRGKKWNVIRQRVDSASFDVDQLFIGTLLFTALLFLLPTVGLYYVVFTALRLVVLGIQGVIQKLIEVFNLIPVASLICWIFSPKTLSDRCKFTAIPRTSNAPQYLLLQMQPAPISKIMTLLYEREDAEKGPSFLRKLCTGEIVYPWIEPEKS